MNTHNFEYDEFEPVDPPATVSNRLAPKKKPIPAGNTQPVTPNPPRPARCGGGSTGYRRPNPPGW